MAIRELTRLGTDPRKIARLLQSKAPEGHILAYITPEEADVLKARGGSGEPHADTGIPSFQEDDYGAFDMDQPGAGGTVAEQQATPEANYEPFQFGAPTPESYQAPMPAAAAMARRGEEIGATPQVPTRQLPPVEDRSIVRPDTATTETKKPFFSEDTLKKLGLAGIAGIPGALLARRAGAQAGAAKGEMQALAAPYQQQGAALQAAAGRGELTPAAQQSLQAVQARLAQGAEQRGGVGAAQSAAQLEAFRQQLLQSQADFGLRLSQIGDQVAIGAIRSGIQADQYVNQLTNSFFNNVLRVASGSELFPAQQTPGPR